MPVRTFRKAIANMFYLGYQTMRLALWTFSKLRIVRASLF